MKYFSIILLLGAFVYADIDKSNEKAHKQMVETIQKEVKHTHSYLGSKKLDQKVIDAMGIVKRDMFVPLSQRKFAYENRPLPIGHGQTISQPYMVAVMTDLLKPKDTDIVLEIGTGSGYQAAILAKIVKKVYTIEIIEPLALGAKKRLEKLGYKNIDVRIGDGYYGLGSIAPFDAIIVTAAAGHIPPPLLKQLKPGGRMVIPVGSQFFVQQLVFVKKDNNGKISIRQILPVAFVPLTGKH